MQNLLPRNKPLLPQTEKELCFPILLFYFQRFPQYSFRYLPFPRPFSNFYNLPSYLSNDFRWLWITNICSYSLCSNSNSIWIYLDPIFIFRKVFATPKIYREIPIIFLSIAKSRDGIGWDVFIRAHRMTKKVILMTKNGQKGHYFACCFLGTYPSIPLFCESR